MSDLELTMMRRVEDLNEAIIAGKAITPDAHPHE